VAGLLAVIVLVFVFGPSLLPAVQKRNVVLIVADALRADHLSCYGFDRATSPNLDSLAAGGLRGTDFNTVVPSTLASFTSLFTSRYPKDHGAARNGFSPFEDLSTVAEAFRDAGYETVAFVSSYCVSSEFGVDRGFDHFDEDLTITTALADNELIRSAELVTGAFLRWLDDREGDKPFFVLIHYFDPHWPYEPPERFASVMREERSDMMSASYEDIVKAISLLQETDGVPDDYVRALHDLYCAEIRYMDEEIGRILKRFRGDGETGGETVLVFTADHGETFWEHVDYFYHGWSVYETAISIPLIFNCPGLIPPHTVRDIPFSNIDLAPTLCRLTGVPLPESFTGSSFDAYVIASGDQDRDDIARLEREGEMRARFSEASKPSTLEKKVPRPNYLKAKSVRRGPWKYVVFPAMRKPGELYNVESDPEERENLAGREEYASMIKSFKRELKDWADDFEKQRDRERLIDPEIQKKLEKLGY